MNYYYDLLLNFNEIYYMFYEWECDDVIEKIKKIPIFHIDNNTFISIINNKIKVNKDFVKSLYNKTKLKNNGELEYACIFSDGKNSVGVEFDTSGIIINKSSLLLEDEININEFMYNTNKIDLEYEIIEKEKVRYLSRQDYKIKKIIKIELDNIYMNKNLSKLKYIYLEWFNKLDDNIDNMYKKMIDSLNGELTEKEYNIYELIKITYNV